MKWHLPKLQQFIALVLAVLLVGTAPVFAADYYAPGPREYELDRTYMVSADKAALNGNDLIFESGGSITFDFPMPFDSEKLTLTYNTIEEAVQLDIQTDENAYSCNIEPGTTACDVAVTEGYGSKTLTITANKPITITGFTFHKIAEMPVKTFESTSVELGEYDEALCSAIVVKSDASAIKSRGAIHRLDVTNPNVVPQIVNGSMYIPLNVLATVFKLYCEDYADKSYVLLRDDKLELALIGGKGYLTHINGEKTYKEVNLFYRDGYTWVPVRQIAEMFGHHVEYRDGCAVIDDRLWAEQIVSDDEIFAQLQAELSEYIPSPVPGKTYHVAKSASASDANSGTEKYPFATLKKAAAVAKAGDIVIIHEGTYREILRPLNDGTKSSPIIFRAAEGENVVISALEPVNNFVEYDGNIYCAPLLNDLGDGRNQLFYKGEGLEEGRYPDTDTKPGVYPLPESIPDKYWATKGNISIKVEEGDIATSDTDLNQPVDYWKGGVFVTMKGYAWSLVSGDIVSSAPGEIKVKDHDGLQSYGLGLTQGLWHNTLYGNTTTKYYKNVHPEDDWGYITNHLNTVNLPGEWYIGDNRIYVYPPEDADLSSDFEVKQRQLTIDLRDRKYITVEGINTLGGGMTMAGETEGNVLNGGSHRYISHYTKCIDNQAGFINDGDSRLSEGAPHAGEVGFFIGGQNNAIINTTIEWSAAAGIRAMGIYHLIANNLVENTSYTGSYVSGIAIGNELTDVNTLNGGHTVVRNTSRNAGRAAFQYSFSGLPGASDATAQPSLASEIAYNDFAYGGVLTRDTGVTYEYSTYHGNDRLRTSMHHNYVHDLGYSDEAGKNHLFLIYQDGYVAGRETYNNITFKSDEPSIGRNGVFEQSQTRVRMWQNTDLGVFPEGLDGLQESYFPSGRPFYAGCDHDGNDRYMVNYDNLVTGKEVVHRPDSSDTSGDKPVYSFDNVYVPGNGYSGLALYYMRPVDAEMNFSVKVEVTGDEHSYTSTVPVGSTNKYWYIDAVSENFVYLPDMPEGEYDIKIEFSDAESEFYGISSFKAEDRFADMVNPNILYGGTYDDMIPGTQQIGGTFGKTARHGLDYYVSGTWLSMHDTWCHTVVYDDRTTTIPANALEICYGTAAAYGGQKLKIYVDSLDSEPIAETVLSGDSWMAKRDIVELKRQLQPGTYKFYLKFEYPDGKTACSNFYYVKFMENAPQEVVE